MSVVREAGCMMTSVISTLRATRKSVATLIAEQFVLLTDVVHVVERPDDIEAPWWVGLLLRGCCCRADVENGCGIRRNSHLSATKRAA